MEHSAFVKRPDGRTFIVKNLGWLLRHLSQSQAVLVEVTPVRSDELMGTQWLAVRFADGYLFTSTYNDPTVLRLFLSARRNLAGVTLVWHGVHQPADWQQQFKDNPEVYRLNHWFDGRR